MDIEMYESTTTCPNCKTVWNLSWPRDENFKCICGEDGYWSHITEEEDHSLYWFWSKTDGGKNNG